jgi:hypothetical protein
MKSLTVHLLDEEISRLNKNKKQLVDSFTLGAVERDWVVNKVGTIEVNSAHEITMSDWDIQVMMNHPNEDKAIRFVRDLLIITIIEFLSKEAKKSSCVTKRESLT